MSRWVKKILVALPLLLAAMQLIRPARTNPPFDPAQTLQARVPDGQPAVPVINRACRDCHSNETSWPWYSEVAPVSWFLAHDVNEGRREVNFSAWGNYAPDRQRKLLKESCEQVSKGDMPMWIYTVIHTDARLSPADVRSICDLAGAAGRE